MIYANGMADSMAKACRHENDDSAGWGPVLVTS